VKNDPLYPAFVTVAMTGMRRAEVCGLRWADVDLDAAHLSITRTVVVVRGVPVEGEPKTTRGRRVVDLDPVTVGVLRAWKAQRRQDQVKTGQRDDRVVLVHPEVLSDAFDRAVRRAKVPRIRFHDLRHTHASLLAAAAVPPHVISARLGHATVGFTLSVYAHVLPGHQADAAASVARVVFGDVL
jgi:integrase